MATPIVVNPTQPSQVVVNGTQKSGTPIQVTTDLDYNRVQSMIDEKIGDVKIDTTELAKQGENAEATNSAIYGTLNEIKGDVIDVVKLQLEEVDNLLDI